MPPSPTDPFVTVLVLGAGGSKRLGRPKQLLPYGHGTLLGHVVGVARTCPFDQTIVAIGRSADDVRATVDLAGADVVVLGDQPGVTADTVAALLAGRGDAALAVCRYDDGHGHPIAFARSVFGALAHLHGDKGVWRLLDQRATDVTPVPVTGQIPLDVDTPEDYQAVLAALTVA